MARDTSLLECSEISFFCRLLPDTILHCRGKLCHRWQVNLVVTPWPGWMYAEVVLSVYTNVHMPTPCVNTHRKRKPLLSICRAFNDAHRCQPEFNSLGECLLIYTSTLWLCSACAFFDCGFGWGIDLVWGQTLRMFWTVYLLEGFLGSFMSKQSLTLPRTRH